LIGLVAVALGLALLSVGGLAQSTNETVTLNEPNTQTVEIPVTFSNSGNVTADLSKDGTVVESDSVSGSSGTSTLLLDGTGLAQDDYTLTVGSHENATVGESTIIDEKRANLTLSKNDTVAVDVEFDAQTVTTANITLSDGGTQLNTSSLVFDPVEFEDGNGIKTYEYQLQQNVTGLNATVETTTAAGYSQAWVSEDTGGSLIGGAGIIAGASETQILGFLAVVAGLVLAYNRDLI
jgi:hypothetical protein